MRVSKEQAAANREQIVHQAARLFRERGFDGIGVAELMKNAGLTHGGFYGHFDSKEQLMAEACEYAIGVTGRRWRRLVSDSDGPSMDTLARRYLSKRHRDAPGDGCVLAALAGAEGGRVISVGYLGLAPEPRTLKGAGASWAPWSRFYPWEDHRGGRPAVLNEVIEPALRNWIDEAAGPGARAARYDRARATFALDDAPWTEERALDRYELLYEAGLVPEAARDQSGEHFAHPIEGLGEPMASDHRRILATAISRLRGKLKYRPVVFELMPELFTLSQLQRVVEAIAGYPIHKQNFRRALDRAGFVEGTGRMQSQTGGRPAELYRFRREAVRKGEVLGLATPRLKDGA